MNNFNPLCKNKLFHVSFEERSDAEILLAMPMPYADKEEPSPAAPVAENGLGRI